MRLEKYQALGNDFLVLLDLDGSRPVDAALARALCDRHRGVGADGLLRVSPGARDTDVTMELYNADGGRAEMSGNGIRCLALAVRDAGVATGDRITVATDAGVRDVTFEAGGAIASGMGAVHVKLDAGPTERTEGPGWSDLADVGNPHVVVYVSDPVETDIEIDGPAVQEVHGPVNVEFVAAGPGPDELTLRIWERGVGETWSCGTGSVAAAASAHRRGLVGPRVVVHQPGGDLTVDLDGDQARLTGPAEHVFTAEVDA